ncbi:Leucine Rich Repeat [Musa troglodytarum]|uniref:Leucine Rich Repeat n=1 Tax=Musa troglodytarum TaxID=320322 RepID=A0A9E7FX18_9LILI|nr:Leucine Rich Repeat [Musa troglodytarum]
MAVDFSLLRSFLVLLLLLHHHHTFVVYATEKDQPPPLLLLPAGEQEAAYLALESINPSIPWRSLYPDDLCLSGPHGIVCDLFPPLSSSSAKADASPHVVELNFGYLSDFSSNPACGLNATLPTSLSSFPFLRKLFFYNCFTTARAFLTRDLWNLSLSVEELVFHQNPSLAGRLSGRVGGFPRLRRLIVSGTRIFGIIPPEVGKLQQLEQLVLSRNRLRGEIPGSIGRLGVLKVLDLCGNRIGGALPAEIGWMTALVKLDLGSNRISGRVPPELGQLRRVELLDLSENRLTGGVPAALAEMASLRELHLSRNPLGGTIPEIWEKLGGILGIGMSRLGLVGNIPSSMGLLLGNVRYLAMDNNKLEGEVPEQFRRMEGSAVEINLENNGLRGRLPFSAAFVDRLGSKLKLGGNRELCMGEDLASGIAGLRRCNKAAVPRPVLFTSGVSSSYNYFLFLSVIFFFFSCA